MISWITKGESNVIRIHFLGRDSLLLKEKMQERNYSVIEGKDTKYIIQSDPIEADVINQEIQTIVDELVWQHFWTTFMRAESKLMGR